MVLRLSEREADKLIKKVSGVKSDTKTPLTGLCGAREVSRYRPRPCFICHQLVKLSGESFGFLAISKTKPVEVKVYHFNCLYK